MKNNNFNFSFMQWEDNYDQFKTSIIDPILDYSDDTNNKFNFKFWKGYVHYLSYVLAVELDNWLSDDEVEENSVFKWTLGIKDTLNEYALSKTQNKDDGDSKETTDENKSSDAESLVKNICEQIWTDDAIIEPKLEILLHEYLCYCTTELRDLSAGNFRDHIIISNGNIVFDIQLTKKEAIDNIITKNNFFNEFKLLKNQLHIDGLYNQYEDIYEDIKQAVMDELELFHDKLEKSKRYESECYISIPEEKGNNFIFNRYVEFMTKRLYSDICDITGNLPTDIKIKTLDNKHRKVFVIENFDSEAVKINGFLSTI